MENKEIPVKFDARIKLECPPEDNEQRSHVPKTMVIKEPGDEFGTSVGVCPPEDDEFPPSPAIPEPSIVSGEATSSKTEQEAGNEARKQFLEGKEYGGARLKYKGDKSACKMLDRRQSEFGEHIKILGDEPFAQHQKGQDCSKEGDSEFQMVHQEQNHCELPSTSRGAVTPDDDQVKQTTRPPCAPEDDKVPLRKPVQETGDPAVPPVDDQGKINYKTIVIVLDTNSSTEDITPSIETLFNFIDLKKVKKLVIINAQDQKKSIRKGIINTLKIKENVEKSEIEIETLVCRKKDSPALISRILTNANESISNISQMIVVCDEDTKQLAVKWLVNRAFIFFLWSMLAPKQTNDETLSEIGEFIKDATSVTIFDADNYTKFFENYIKRNPKVRCLAFGNEKTMELLDKNIEIKNNKNVFLGRPSIDKKEAADCDTVKVIEYIAVKYPHIKIIVVSDDKVFKMFTEGKGKKENIMILNPGSTAVTAVTAVTT